MGPALRRSRRSTPKKTSSYSVGDIVEIVRGTLTLKGRLAYKLTEGVSPNPRWLVTFDNEPHKDEELYEKAFGRLIKPADEEGDKPGISPRRARPASNILSHAPARKPSRNSTSSEDGDSEEKKKSKSVSFSDLGTPAQSDDSSSQGREKNVSAREQRSLRRQAKIDEVAVTLPPQALGNNGSVNGNGISSTSRSSRKRRLPPPRGGSKKQKSDSANGEEVVKVKLLTGTLYLYRGLHRRAEFVRRF